MKRKPMLMNKLQHKTFGRGREVIGLIGTHHGVGVTYTGLMLAFYMGEECGLKTAFVECNRQHDMELIRNSYEWDEKEDSFTFHQITCYKEVLPERISRIYGEDYECIILDFGTEMVSNREEFLRCSEKIIIAGRSEWDIQKLKRFLEASEAYRGSDTWRYFVPQASDKTVFKIQSEVERKVWAVPATEDPVVPSASSNRFFRKIFLT